MPRNKGSKRKCKSTKSDSGQREGTDLEDIMESELPEQIQDLTTEPNQKKLKTLVKKDSDPGEWSASEELPEDSNTIRDNLLGERESKIQEIEICGEVVENNLKRDYCSNHLTKVCKYRKRSGHKRKVCVTNNKPANESSSKTLQGTADCINHNQKTDIQKLRPKVSEVRMRACDELRTFPAENMVVEFAQKTDCGKNKTKIHLSKNEAVVPKEDLINANHDRACLPKDEYSRHIELASKDVYVVELCDDENCMSNCDRDFESQIPLEQRLHEKVDIKLLPYGTSVDLKYNDDKGDSMYLSSTDYTLYDKEHKIVSIDYDMEENEEETTIEVIGQSCTSSNTDRSEKTESSNICQTKRIDDVYTSHSLFDNTAIDDTFYVKIAHTSESGTEKVQEKKTGLNEPFSERNRNVSIIEDSPVMEVRQTEISINSSTCKTDERNNSITNMPGSKTNTSVNDNAMEMKTDVNRAVAVGGPETNLKENERKEIVIDTLIGQKTSESLEEKKFNLIKPLTDNDTRGEVDRNDVDTNFDALFQMNSLNTTEENFKDIDELINWTVGHTINPAENANTHGVQDGTEAVNLMTNTEGINHLGSEEHSNDSNCWIEVYVIDDKEVDENNNMDDMGLQRNASNDMHADFVANTKTCQTMQYETVHGSEKRSFDKSVDYNTCADLYMPNESIVQANNNDKFRLEGYYSLANDVDGFKGETLLQDKSCSLDSCPRSLSIVSEKEQGFDRSVGKYPDPPGKRSKKRKNIHTKNDDAINGIYPVNDSLQKDNPNVSSTKMGYMESEIKPGSDMKKSSVTSKTISNKCKTCNIMEWNRKKRCNLCTRIADDLVERKRILKKMKSGLYGERPHVVRVKHDGLVIDVSEEYRDYLPYE